MKLKGSKCSNEVLYSHFLHLINVKWEILYYLMFRVLALYVEFFVGLPSWREQIYVRCSILRYAFSNCYANKSIVLPIIKFTIIRLAIAGCGVRILEF